ncbi:MULTISPECIES: SMI1/KNR4 family protein [Pseudomonadaceae]|uniref:SMI1/KNR4 family protein n=1 Tax=Pseudomonadaceae TaxID=135621 RepID=UPI000BAB3B6E|nr:MULTISPECIES: SMI1/KNR4 family protein [Pseudomonadaceae]MCQ2049114.1 SMI1/KNR4 family protein [Stutzerimonas kunmingensis]PAU51780.1 SMI1/KNR4 family protein [Pseudomonas indica]PKR25630.1 SMI1/KNR4 family protein [Stutzerimonas stutzeri]QQC11838.1 SMI1/KNR4 family protein [Stutzerimonas stutzeri]
MWQELIKQHSDAINVRVGASDSAIRFAERTLVVKFPGDLKTLLLESDGIEGEYGLGLVWPLDRIVEDNLSFRRNTEFKELYMPFDCLLFFADAGNGDQFAFPIHAGGIRRDDVFVWNHEDDSRTWAAPSLSKYLEWWLSGKLTV